MVKYMAKKTVKKNEEKNETQIVDIPPVEITAKEENTLVSLEGTTKGVIAPMRRKMGFLTIQEIESFERMLRMLVLYYEQMLRIDEVEGRPVMSDNRNKYTRLSALHKKLMEYIENKVLTLEDYDWEG